jgi:hypothetical protein
MLSAVLAPVLGGFLQAIGRNRGGSEALIWQPCQGGFQDVFRTLDLADIAVSIGIAARREISCN